MVSTSKRPTFIFVTGGVLSGLGKGVAGSAIGKLLTLGGLKVIPIKCEGYLNIDPGTMNPVEHGEVFVLDDGEEADMDFGHYERMLGVRCEAHWNITMGKVYQTIFDRERKGDFLGKTVQLIPHVTDEIKRRWVTIAKQTQADVVLVEIGGTVGDIETEMYVEAARQMKKHVGSCVYVHLTYVPIPSNIGEPKTKPTQQSVSLLREHGIFPDIIICRSPLRITKEIKEKIALFCDVDVKAVISGHDVDSIYEVPLIYAQEGLVPILERHVRIPKSIVLTEWKRLVNNIKKPKRVITVALCGKYTALEDSYASILEALVHAGAHTQTKIDIRWIDTEKVSQGEHAVAELLQGVHGVIVPGGFGTRGTEGKIAIIHYARQHRIPFLGICYGLQLAVVEFARSVCGLKNAHTAEADSATKYPVVSILESQKHVTHKGGTMRLGRYTADIVKDSLVHRLYGKTKVEERHRHRYEVNPAFHKPLSDHGLLISGTSHKGVLAEFIELPEHPFFVATQAHPELLSRLETPSPLFLGLVRAGVDYKKELGIHIQR